MPILLFIHQFFSLTQLELLCFFLHDFDSFLPLLHGWNFILVLLNEWVARIYNLGFFQKRFCLPHAARACCAFNSTFFYLFLIFPHMEVIFGVVEWMCSKALRSGVVQKHFSLRHAARACCAFNSMFFYLFLIFPHLGFHFWYCAVNGKRRPMIWVWIEVIFSFGRPSNIFWGDLVTWVIFPHFPFSILGSQDVFFHIQNLSFVV